MRISSGGVGPHRAEELIKARWSARARMRELPGAGAGAGAGRLGHFTPNSYSWANTVGTFFASLTPDGCSAASSARPVDLQAALNRYLGEYNRKPKPFVWTADPDRIIEKINRGYQVMASDH